MYRLKAKLENAQGEQESLRQEMERAGSSVQRIIAERDKVSPIHSTYYLLTLFCFSTLSSYSYLTHSILFKIKLNKRTNNSKNTNTRKARNLSSSQQQCSS